MGKVREKRESGAEKEHGIRGMIGNRAARHIGLWTMVMFLISVATIGCTIWAVAIADEKLHVIALGIFAVIFLFIFIGACVKEIQMYLVRVHKTDKEREDIL